jgi:Flp pilus assembly protein TadG
MGEPLRDLDRTTASGKRSPMRFISRFGSDRRGIAAVEFALIALPFFVLTFGLIEIVLVFILSTTLDYGVQEAARRVRTGELQAAAGDMTKFKAAVCGELFALMDCDSKLSIDVRKLDSFAASDAVSSPIDTDKNMKKTDFTFDPGKANDIVMVRVFYEWALVTPVISAPLANLANGKRLIVSTATFRNEPF